MPGQDYSQAYAFIAAIAGDPATAVIDWRALHDTNKTIAGHARRGTLSEWWQWLCEMNDAGYGIFCTIAQMDGVGRELANVQYIRAQYIDLDGQDAPQQYQRAAAFYPAPAFAVNSSPGKFHTYWPLSGWYSDNDRFTVTQRKLRQLFNGDKSVVDAARVMRIAGFWHTKAEPHLVTCHSLPGYGVPVSIEQLEAALQHVNIIDGGHGVRKPLGDPDLAAPSLDWINYALALIDPNELNRAEWLSLMAATKQAGWSITDHDTLYQLWSAFCARYEKNDIGENDKQWHSLNATEIGWPSLLRRAPGLHARMVLGGEDRTSQLPPAAFNGGLPTPPDAPPMPVQQPPALDCSGEFLTHLEQQQWFNGVSYVINVGEMLDADGRFLNVSQFNAKYGGKYFIIDGEGKKTDEAWKAATRSILWRVPQVDHTRFLPSRSYRETIIDPMGRKGINTYKPLEIERIAGDPSPFLNHLGALLPDPGDQRIILDYLAHNVKYPGFKIPWAPLIQSLEGAGKGVFKFIMQHAMGRPYIYFPNAKELTNSGSQFNAWMSRRLFIIADEIKVDDRLDLIEVLKPMISEEIIEIQRKGFDQELEDNFSNWMFFTNYKNAIPINKNGRRFAIMFSPLQTIADLQARGMDDYYFKCLYSWIRGEGNYPFGAAIVADYLMNYPIERGAIPMRAPDTSSTAEALLVSQSPIERTIRESLEDDLPGFRHGWISSIALTKRLRATGAVGRAPTPATIASIVEAMGYVSCGRAPRMYMQESPDARADLYHFGGFADVNVFGPLQGYG